MKIAHYIYSSHLIFIDHSAVHTHRQLEMSSDYQLLTLACAHCSRFIRSITLSRSLASLRTRLFIVTVSSIHPSVLPSSSLLSHLAIRVAYCILTFGGPAIEASVLPLLIRITALARRIASAVFRHSFALSSTSVVEEKGTTTCTHATRTRTSARAHAHE